MEILKKDLGRFEVSRRKGNLRMLGTSITSSVKPSINVIAGIRGSLTLDTEATVEENTDWITTRILSASP